MVLVLSNYRSQFSKECEFYAAIEFIIVANGNCKITAVLSEPT